MSGFRVEFDRPLVCKKRVKGLDVHQPSGMCYVDCFFPDGTQGTYGYIGVNPIPGSVFAPLAHCTQDIANLVQAEIDKQLGTEGTLPPVIIVQETEEDEDDDE